MGFDPGSAKLTIVLNHEAGWRDCAQAGSLFDVSRYDGGVGCGLGMWPVFREKSGFLRRRAELWGRCVYAHVLDWRRIRRYGMCIRRRDDHSRCDRRGLGIWHVKPRTSKMMRKSSSCCSICCALCVVQRCSAAAAWPHGRRRAMTVRKVDLSGVSLSGPTTGWGSLRVE